MVSQSVCKQVNKHIIIKCFLILSDLIISEKCKAYIGANLLLTSACRNGRCEPIDTISASTTDCFAGHA